jgi:hypothetical protein
MLAEEKLQILSFLKEQEEDNRGIQVKLLQQENISNQKDQYLDELDQTTGCFSINMANNLQSQVVNYLNRLIHGLLTVSNKLFEKHFS